MNELKITWKDWLSIFATGILFSALLSMLAYFLLQISIISGLIFGILLGFFIAFFSFVFVTAMNLYLLPNFPKRSWTAVAVFFSFLSGFLGTLTTYILSALLDVPTIELFRHDPIVSASIIGILTYLMGSLMHRFVKVRNEKEENESLLIQSRLRSLETQLNPHFLFNALNSLSELVHMEPSKAENAIIKLSRFLRHSMEEKPLITLQSELRNVQDYIDLETIRFPSIILHTDIFNDTLLMMVPKFSIQLLVENAIKHGLDHRLESFEISIHIRFSNQMIIRVSNNGKAVTSTSFGIGLSNLQERINYLCGGTLTLESPQSPVIYQITIKECNENIDRG